MAKVRFNGPSGQVNYSVGIETGNSQIEPDAVYDVSDDLAKALVRSSKHWVKVKEPKVVQTSNEEQ